MRTARRCLLVLAATLLLLPVGACAQQDPEARESGDAAARPSPAALEALWTEGVTYDAFLDDARRRRETWLDNTERARAPEALLRRLAAAGGSWRVLAVAEDWCGDSVHTLPYVAALAEAAPSLEIRVVRSRPGRAVMESHRTPDDRAATPTFLLLDAEGRDRGCFVERPPDLQEWYMRNHDTLPELELHAGILGWYDRDAGAASMAELVSVVEAAARGDHRCVGAGDARDPDGQGTPATSTEALR